VVRKPLQQLADKPDEFLFWDGIHPTKVAHALLAEEAATVLLP
jgi:phospholipase/lecithinase/hemolysin